MNKKDRIELCIYNDKLLAALRKISNAVVFRPETQKEYDEIYDKVHDRIQKLDDLIYEMFDAFELEETYFKEIADEHIGCYSYPNCDLSPTGCTKIYGSDAEPFGHR